MICTDGKGYKQDHAAEGWTVSPEGKPVVQQCARHAQECIAEYAEKLGESWTFRAAAEQWETSCSVCGGTFRGTDYAQVVRAGFACVEACSAALISTP